MDQNLTEFIIWWVRKGNSFIVGPNCDEDGQLFDAEPFMAQFGEYSEGTGIKVEETIKEAAMMTGQFGLGDEE